MSLTDREVRNITPGSKRQRHYDERGLYLEVAPSGGKWWLQVRFAGKEKRHSLGAYPEVGLKEARIKCDEARKLLHDGVDPGEERKQQKAALGRPSKGDSFESVAREWFAKFAPQWADACRNGYHSSEKAGFPSHREKRQWIRWLLLKSLRFCDVWNRAAPSNLPGVSEAFAAKCSVTPSPRAEPSAILPPTS